jgi:hypothetical protein
MGRTTVVLFALEESEERIKYDNGEISSSRLLLLLTLQLLLGMMCKSEATFPAPQSKGALDTSDNLLLGRKI